MRNNKGTTTMSEHEPKSVNSATFINDLEAAKSLLSKDNQDLAEIHPTVSEFVDTDPTSEDFGRMKHVEMAEALAYYQDETREDELDKAGIGLWLNQVAFHNPSHTKETARAEAFAAADERTTQRMATEVKYQAQHSGASSDEASKASQDYLITQGDARASNQRLDAVYEDIEVQKGGPSFIAAVRAARALNKVLKVSRKQRRG